MSLEIFMVIFIMFLIIIYETNIHNIVKHTHKYSIKIYFIINFFYIELTIILLICIKKISLLKIDLHIIINFYMKNQAFDKKKFPQK
jgi:hypothetical protein